MADLIPAGPWHDEPELWDRVVFGDVEAPGIATVEVTRSNKWDEKKAKGSHGGEREYSGADLAKIKITIVTWTSEQHAEMRDKVLPLVEPVPGKKKVDAVPVQHAVTILRGVSSVTIDEVDGPSVSDGKATWKIDAKEHREPETSNATGTAKGVPSAAAAKAAGSCADLTQLYVQAAAAAEQAKRNRDAIQVQLQALGYAGGEGDSVDPDPQVQALRQQWVQADGVYDAQALSRDTIAVQMQAVCGSGAAPSSTGKFTGTSDAEAAA